MKFEEALKAMREGKKVKLPLLVPHYEEVKIVNGVLLCRIKRKFEIFISVPLKAVMSEDWEVVEDE